MPQIDGGKDVKQGTITDADQAAEAGLTAGTYQNATVTVNTKGKVTAIVAGSGGTSGLTVSESIGAGADIALTTTYATVPNITISVPANQAVDVDGLAELTADGTTGLDDFYVQLYDTVAGAAILNSERHISYLPAGKRGLVTLEKFVPGLSAGRTLVLQAKNSTAARGTVSSAKSLLQALSVTSGTSNVASGLAPKPPAGTTLRTSGNTLLTSLVFALPINEGAGTTLRDWVSGTTATINTGWGWSTDSTGQTVLQNNTSSTEAALFAGIAQVASSFSVLVLYSATNPSSYGLSTFFGQGDPSGSAWNISMDGRPSFDETNESASVNGTAISGNATVLALRTAGTSWAGYNLSTGNSGLISSVSDMAGNLRAGASAGWHIGGSYINGQRYLQGSIKGVFIWSRALTAAEISSLAGDPWQMFAGY